MTRDERGMALAIVLFVMVMLTLLGVLGIYRVGRDVDQAGDFRRDSQAFYIAEAGIYRAVAELNDDINWTGPFTNLAFANGNFTVTRTDPDVLRMILTSVGTTNTNPASQVTLQAVGLKVGSPGPIWKFAIFTSQTLELSANNQVTDGNVYAGLNIILSTSDAVVDGDVSAYQQVIYESNANILRGHVLSNDGVDLTTQERVRIAERGGIWTGGAVNHGNLAIQVPNGPVNENSSPAPVMPVSYYEDNFQIQDDEFTDFYAQALAAGNVHPDGYRPPEGNYTGIHYVTGDLKISGDYSGDAIWVVDGNLDIDGNISVSNDEVYTFIVQGDIFTTGIGGGSIDAFIYANGTIDAAGNTLVNGGVISFGGVTGKGSFRVNYETPSGIVQLPGGALKFKIISLDRI